MKILWILCLLPIHIKAIIHGVNMNGLETETMSIKCLEEHPVDWHLNQMQNIGFNTIRIPFSYRYIEQSNWDNLDEVMNKVKNYNLNVVLNFFSIETTFQNPKPYDFDVTFDMFLEAWVTILTRDRKSVV
jgi:aryl-phospho-beta-D-glucosidase BglC (GH1 family)